MAERHVIFTIDVDMIDYLDDQSRLYNELGAFYPVFDREILSKTNIPCTWFLRIDSQVEQVLGTAEYILTANKAIVQNILDNGGALGWHHHAYKQQEGKWIQELDENIVLSAIKKYGKTARENKLIISRMGWGYQTNTTLRAISELGFAVDSTSIPRPKYKWDLNFMDWEGAETQPYFPSEENYKKNGSPSLDILEVPVTTAYLAADYDTEKVIRYVNPAFHHHKFTESFNNIENKDLVCMVMHPYEVLPNKKEHALISFSMADLLKNILFLKSKGYTFISYNDVLKAYTNEQTR